MTNKGSLGGRRRSRKGVSTVVGMTIFLLMFAIAVAYIFAWSQNSGTYIDTVKHQIDFEMSRLTENLEVTPINYTSVFVENPTTNVIVVTQLWTNNKLTWSGNQGISPLGNWTFTGNQTGDGNYKVVTYRGNIFSGGLKSQLDLAIRRSWEASWYWRDGVNQSVHDAMLPNDLLANLNIGTTYWYDLNLAYDWNFLSNPVIEKVYNMTDQVSLGFVAKTTLIKLSNSSYNATINYYISNSSRIAIGIDGNVPLVWTGGPLEITGEKYSLHTVTVYFDGYGRSDAYVRLNIVNATFAP
jgi:hypothetical protein